MPARLFRFPQSLSVALGASVILLGGCLETGIQLRWDVVDTGQDSCFDDTHPMTSAPVEGEAFFGQDAQYDGHQPDYDRFTAGVVELVEDEVTSLVWTRDLAADGTDSDTPKRFTFAEAKAFIDSLNAEGYAGYDDWRLPQIKELYSLIDFRGSSSLTIPYIREGAFEFEWGDANGNGTDETGEMTDEHPWRAIDAQVWSATEYVAGIGPDADTDGAFGVNFADGRIKCYPTVADGEHGRLAEHYLRPVRGDFYGLNRFTANHGFTVTDSATELVWQRYDAGPMDWEAALSYAENLILDGHDDWRLPNAKELQSIVDYSRAPAAGGSEAGPAIDPVFYTTDQDGWFWSSTTHQDDFEGRGAWAVYICFGRGLSVDTTVVTGEDGLPEFEYPHIDTHGAGAQRSDPKSYEALPSVNYLRLGFGPQHDVIRVENYVRCVRDASPLAKPIDPDWSAFRPPSGATRR